jgi:hypothetical protein
MFIAAVCPTMRNYRQSKCALMHMVRVIMVSAQNLMGKHGGYICENRVVVWQLITEKPQRRKTLMFEKGWSTARWVRVLGAISQTSKFQMSYSRGKISHSWIPWWLQSVLGMCATRRLSDLHRSTHWIPRLPWFWEASYVFLSPSNKMAWSGFNWKVNFSSLPFHSFLSSWREHQCYEVFFKTPLPPGKAESIKAH